MASKRRAGVFVLGVCVSAVLLLVIGMRLDWRVFQATMAHLRYPWIGAAGLASAVSLMGRARRWQLISNTASARYKTFWQAVAMGGLGNLMLPARAGEFVRVGVVHRLTGVPLARVAASAVADRMADMATLCGFCGIAAFLTLRKTLANAVLVRAAGVLLLPILGITLSICFWPQIGSFLKGQAERRGGPWWGKVLQWHEQILLGTSILRQPLVWSRVIGLSVAVFLLDFSTLWCVMRALDWSLPFWAAMLVGVFLGAGSSLPSAPGAIGIFQVACVLALRVFDIPESGAVAYSVVVQALLYVLYALQGGWGALQLGFKASWPAPG